MWNRIWFCLNVLKLFKANWWSRPWFSQSWQEFCVQKFFPLLDSNAQTALTVLNTVSQKFSYHRKKMKHQKETEINKYATKVNLIEKYFQYFVKSYLTVIPSTLAASDEVHVCQLFQR